MDPLFVWIETGALSTVLRESASIMAFPFILILHTVGLGFLVGANVAINGRVLGLARGVPLLSLRRYYRVMWAGFWVNAFSGALLLIAYPTKALTNPVFYLKLALIAAALWMARAIRRHAESAPVAAGVGAPQALRALALAGMACWLIAIVAGRFLAYTCTRLTWEHSC
jgi:hypothetical protein